MWNEKFITQLNEKRVAGWRLVFQTCVSLALLRDPCEDGISRVVSHSFCDLSLLLCGVEPVGGDEMWFMLWFSIHSSMYFYPNFSRKKYLEEFFRRFFSNNSGKFYKDYNLELPYGSPSKDFLNNFSSQFSMDSSKLHLGFHTRKCYSHYFCD